MFRLVTEDTEIDGVPVPKGARLVLVYSAANRDPAVWGDDPDRFDPDRPSPGTTWRSARASTSASAPLSRLELQVAVEALARRLRTIRLTRPGTSSTTRASCCEASPARCGVHGGPVASVA
jgi:cytochrome P450